MWWPEPRCHPPALALLSAPGTVPPTPGAHICTHTSPIRSLQLSHLPHGHTHHHTHTPLLPTPWRRFTSPLTYPHTRGLPPAWNQPSLTRACTRWIQTVLPELCGYGPINTNLSYRAQLSKCSLSVPLEAHTLPNLPGTATHLTHLWHIRAPSCLSPTYTHSLRHPQTTILQICPHLSAKNRSCPHPEAP